MQEILQWAAFLSPTFLIPGNSTDFCVLAEMLWFGRFYSFSGSWRSRKGGSGIGKYPFVYVSFCICVLLYTYTEGYLLDLAGCIFFRYVYNFLIHVFFFHTCLKRKYSEKYDFSYFPMYTKRYIHI